jgi:hypothetical protein
MGTILTVCAGGLIAGESLLVLLHMHFPAVKPSRTRKNVLLAAADIGLGTILVVCALFWTGRESSLLLYPAAAVLIATHAYREVEYLAGRAAPFTATRGLFVFNHIRIALLIAALGR